MLGRGPERLGHTQVAYIKNLSVRPRPQGEAQGPAHAGRNGTTPPGGSLSGAAPLAGGLEPGGAAACGSPNSPRGLAADRLRPGSQQGKRNQACGVLSALRARDQWPRPRRARCNHCFGADRLPTLSSPLWPVTPQPLAPPPSPPPARPPPRVQPLDDFAANAGNSPGNDLSSHWVHTLGGLSRG